MEAIKIDITILAPIEKVWEYFNTPKHIVKWNFPDENWRCPTSDNDLRVGGTFSHRMEAADKSFGFYYKGIYDEIAPDKRLRYHLEDGRNVEVIFDEIDEDTTTVTEIFDPEKQNSVQMQRDMAYAILNNFHKYVENN